jgi:hypothetical protein
MPNEFVIGSGFIATNNSTVTGSLTVTGGITGSLFGTSSWASNSVSSSYALTSSYAMSVSGGITGTGTSNYVSKFTGTNTLGNSQITDNGTLITLGSTVGIGTTAVSSGANVEIKTSTGGVLRISRDTTFGFVQNFSLGKIEFYNYDQDVPGPLAGAFISAAYEDLFGQKTYLSFGTDPSGGAVERVRITSNGRLLVGGTSADDGVNQLQVSGSGKFATNVIATSFTGSLFGTGSYASNALSSSYALTASYALNAGSGGGGGATNQITSGSATASISPTAGFVVNTNSTFTGSINATGNITASAVLISGSGVQRLTVIGSGSASPLFTVQGSQGELFTVTDTLSGSLFSVGDISGLPILEVFSDNTTLIGSYIAPALYTTFKILSSSTGVNTIYSLPTASYDGVFVDYTIKSGSNARAGTFTATWSGTSVNFMDNSTTDFGNTTGFVFGANISTGNMLVTGSGTTAGWTVKTIIKAI